MGGTIRIGGQETNILKLTIVGVLIYAFARALMATPDALDLLVMSDNDDIMRLLSVRELLDGKPWFDKTNTRLLPPDGLHLHWSRLLDAAQAGLLGGLALVLPLTTAESLAIVLWPSLVFAALVLMTAQVGRQSFGAWTAAVALIFLACWPMILGNYFRPVRLDHHNVQILLGSAVVFSTILRGNPARLGIGAGLAAGLSISIGLENLILFALAGVIMACRSLIDPKGNAAQMASYGASALLTSCILLAVETPRQEWWAQTCDTLSIPVLTLLAAATVISLVYLAVAGRLTSPFARGAVLLGTSIAVLGVSAPSWSPCLQGPYGTLPEDAQRVISDYIIEGRPAFVHFIADPGLSSSLFPAIGAVLAASLVLFYRAKTGLVTDRNELRAVGALLTYAWTGVILLICYQARLIVIAAPAVSLLAGYAVVSLWQMRGKGRSPARSFAFVTAVAATIFGASFYRATGALANAVTGEQEAAMGTSMLDCRQSETLQTLDRLPKSRILAPMDFGAPILLLTDHDALAAPYHRNPDAMMNGVIPFEGEEAPLRKAVASFGADYVVLCRNVVHGTPASFVSSLASGENAEGFEVVEGVHRDLVVLRVNG